MAIPRRVLADADYRGSSVLIALEDSFILVGLRNNTIEVFEKAVEKVASSFSSAVLQLAFEIEPEFACFADDALRALRPPAIRPAIAKELDRLSAVSSTWKDRPYSEIARSVAGIPHPIDATIAPEHEIGHTPSSVPFFRKRIVQQANESRSLNDSGLPDNQCPGTVQTGKPSQSDVVMQ